MPKNPTPRGGEHRGQKEPRYGTGWLPNPETKIGAVAYALGGPILFDVVFNVIPHHIHVIVHLT
jgi:hypothetical protein